MKQLFFSITFVTAGLMFFHPSFEAKAECYGEAAAMHGCGVTPNHQTRGGSLEQFGGRKNLVLPDMGYQQRFNNNDFITVEESRRMMRSLILQGNRSNNTSQAAFQAAIGNTGRSIRRSGGSTSRSIGIAAGRTGRQF